MSAPRPFEEELLISVQKLLRMAVEKIKGDRFEARLQILEACSAQFGGFDIATFHNIFGIKSLSSSKSLLKLADQVIVAIKQLPFHPALALSALAREPLEESNRKSTGAYHTDFRLANRLSELAATKLTHKSTVIDPACGAGILLVALSIKICGKDRNKISEWLANGVFAADLSVNSLRATLLALGSLTDDLVVLEKMRARWLCGDSLLVDIAVWKKMAPDGFDAVIGNPPWEKVKLTRHEFLKFSGTDRHYGAETIGLDEESFNIQREEVANYSQKLLIRYPDLSCGEPDLYIAFTSLFFQICKSDGVVAAFVPGGLIRSQGTKSIRKKLFELSSSISISIIDNRARFFAIDTRFKFLAIVLVKSDPSKKEDELITLLHEKGSPIGLECIGSATIDRTILATIRNDLSLPEVRSQTEWSIFRKISESGCYWNDPSSGWNARFCREVDMTKERPKFLSKPTMTSLPVIEGRMINHHRFGVKGYRSGTGRRSIWEAYSMGASRLHPQFWIEPHDIPESNLARTQIIRAGFCDIAGQTNERSLMASIIPSGVVCGNKVPTVSFTTDSSVERLLVWTAIVNSIPFDWMLRRILTTTVNYFLLQSLPLPRLAKDGLSWQKLLTYAHQLRELDTMGATLNTKNRMAQLRAEIDAEVAIVYGLELDELALMLKDFPLLDRGQPALNGEEKSTITRDMLLAVAAKRMGVDTDIWHKRAQDALKIGAHAYVPSEIVEKNEKKEQMMGAIIND